MPNFTKLSVDQLIYEAHGLYRLDYATSLYTLYLTEAADKFEAQFRSLLSSTPPPNLVLDRSFYEKADRDKFRSLAEGYGARCVLVHFCASEEVLWRRIRERASNPRDADSALDITEDLLHSYVAGFESPQNEGEFLIYVT